jgi:hypothetical protein
MSFMQESKVPDPSPLSTNAGPPPPLLWIVGIVCSTIFTSVIWYCCLPQASAVLTVTAPNNDLDERGKEKGRGSLQRKEACSFSSSMRLRRLEGSPNKGLFKRTPRIQSPFFSQASDHFQPFLSSHYFTLKPGSLDL